MLPILCCSDAPTLTDLLAHARVAVVYRDNVALAFRFPERIHNLLTAHATDVKLIVARVDAAFDFSFPCGLLEFGIFAYGRFVGSLDPETPRSDRIARTYDERKAAVHGAGIDRALLQLIERAAAVAEQSEGTVRENPFAILDIPDSATVTEAEAARRRLVFEVHPDRAGNLGRRGIKLLEDETKRLNGALDAIRRMHGFAGR